MSEVRVVERALLRSVLGVRLVDAARGGTVAAGLRVRVRLADDAREHVLPSSPLSGVFGASTLPGYEDYVANRRPATDWWGSLAEPNGVLLVDDTEGRFLPVRRLLTLPEAGMLTVSLMSTPARAAGGGLIAIRAQLAVAGVPEPAPAAWARISVSLPGVATVTGLADARGVALVLVPAAAALPPLVGSPPHPPVVTAGGPSWPATITVAYDPAVQRPAPAWHPGDPPEAGSIAAQKSASLLDVVGGPAVGQVVRTVGLGRDLVVRTGAAPELLVLPP